MGIYPIITRIYTPEAFGNFTWFTSASAILTIFATGKYESAIILPKSDNKAISLFQLCIIINILFFLFLSIILFLFGEKIADLFNKEVTMFYLLPVCVLFTGIWQAMNYLFIRGKKYKKISSYNITQSIANSLSKCLLGIKNYVQYGLIWGTIIGKVIAVIIQVISGKTFFKGVEKINKEKIKQVSISYSNFPKFILPQSLLILLAGNLPILFFAAYFDATEFGLFSLAFTTGAFSVNLFSESFYQVLYKKMSEKYHKKEKLMTIFSFFMKINAVILILFVLFFLISEEVYAFIFGQEWMKSGMYMKLMLFWMFLYMITASLVFIPDIFMKQKTAMKIEILHIFLVILSLISGYYLKDFYLAIILYFSVATFIRIVKLVWYLSVIRQYDVKLQKSEI